MFGLHIFFQKNVQKSSIRFRHKQHFKLRQYLLIQPLLHLPTTSSAATMIFKACASLSLQGKYEQCSLRHLDKSSDHTNKIFLLYHSLCSSFSSTLSTIRSLPSSKKFSIPAVLFKYSMSTHAAAP